MAMDPFEVLLTTQKCNYSGMGQQDLTKQSCKAQNWEGDGEVDRGDGKTTYLTRLA